MRGNLQEKKRPPFGCPCTGTTAECDQDSALQALDYEACLAKGPFVPILEARNILDHRSAGSVPHGGLD